MRELRQEQLSLAREFIDNGVPVFVAAPIPKDGKYDTRSEFFLPKAWNEIEPDYKHLARWRPGWAVCAVTGVKFDVIDVDPRNGGDKALRRLIEIGDLPPVRGEVLTPSGGSHIYINRTGLRKFSPWKGIDLQAGAIDGKGRGFVYIPPTERVSKATGEIREYTIQQSIDWGRLDRVEAANEGRFQEFKDRVTYTYNKQHARTTQVAAGKDWMGREPSIEEYIEVVGRLMDLCKKLKEAEHGEHDISLHTYSRTVGGLITGSGLDEDIAKEMLREAALTWIIDERDLSWIDYKINRSIEIGKKLPITIHDWH